jgi:Rrf2 family protein
LSTKSRYGLRALFDIAFHTGMLPSQIKDISRRQQISPRYLEQIFQELKKGGLLKSKRGPQGGYRLTRKPEEISVLDVIRATEGKLALVDCEAPGKDACSLDCQCVTQVVWRGAAKALSDYLAGVSLADLCGMGREMGMEQELDHRFMYFI